MALLRRFVGLKPSRRRAPGARLRTVRTGIRARLSLLLLLAFIPVAWVVGNALLDQRRSARQEVERELLGHARSVSADHEQIVRAGRQALMLMAHLPEVQGRDPGRCSTVAAAALTQFPYFSNIAATAPDGTLFCSAVPVMERVGLGDRPYFRRALLSRDVVTGDYVRGRVTGQPILTLAHAARDARGDVTAIGIVGVGLGWIEDLTRQAGLPEDVSVLVFDGTGEVLARYPRITLRDGPGAGRAPVIREALARGRESTFVADGLDGVRRLHAVTLLRGTATPDVRLAVAIPESVAYAGVRSLALQAVASLLVLAALVIGIVWVAGSALLVRPIAELASTAARLGRGDLAARARLRHDGSELGRLARAFDDMAERLSLLHEIDRAILVAESPEDVARAALDRLRALLDAPRAVVALYDLEAGLGRWLAVAGASDPAIAEGATFPLAMMGDLAALARGEIQPVEDVARLDAPQARALLAAGVRSYLVVPLVANGELVGSLNFGAEEPGPFPDEQVQIAREVAAQLGIALSQARLREAVRRHAAELESRVRERTAELHELNARLQGEVLDRRRAEQAADRANRAKSWFLSRMSHELRTPLNAVLGFAQLLEMDGLTETQRESVQHILKAGRHLLALINEVLDIARIESGRLNVSPEPVHVGETLRAALDLVQPLAAERKVRLQIDPSAADDRVVLADRQRLQQVLLNLLSNGIKYNRDGGTVTVACAGRAGDRLRVAVTDTGPGIPPEMLGRLFQPFERLGADRLGVEGTGLGLSLSKGLVEAMGGAIGVESRAGEGSTFWVELPLTEPVETGAGTEAPAPAGVDAAAAPPGTVLYIEDNLSNVRLLERTLGRREGLRFLTAMQGRLGVDLALQHRPGVILLDLHLPDMDGEEVLGLLRGDARTRGIPVIVMSADATESRIRRLTEAGAWAYLTKPLDVRQTLALIDRALAGTTT